MYRCRHRLRRDFGTGSVKGAPLHFLAPTAERSGCEGWIYSAPQQSRWTLQPEGGGVPEGEAAAHRAEPSQRGSVRCGEAAEAAEAELAARCAWYPAAGWPDDKAQGGNLARVLGAVPGAAALAWSRLAVTAPGGADARLLIRSRDVAALKVYVDGRLAAIQPEASAALSVCCRWTSAAMTCWSRPCAAAPAGASAWKRQRLGTHQRYRWKRSVARLLRKLHPAALRREP